LNIIFKYKYWITAALLGAAVFLFPQVKKALEVDNSLMVWFLEDDPALKPYYEFQDYFGNDEVIIMIYHQEQGLLKKEELKKLRSFTDTLLQLDDISGVSGISNAQIPGGGVFASTAKPIIPRGAINANEVRKTLEENTFLKEQFFNEDFTATRIIIQPKLSKNFDDKRSEILNKVYDLADEKFPPGQTYFGGVGVIYQGLNQLSKTDFSRFLGIGYLMMFILIWLIYRRILYVVYALGTIAFSTYFTLGLYGLMGFQLNLLSALIPMIIILLCIMDVMHILNERLKLANEGLKGKELAYQSLQNVWQPCLFTTLTTMAGFLSLCASPMAILKEFGAFSALGIVLGLFFSYLLGTIFLPTAGGNSIRFKTSAVLLKLDDLISRNRLKVSLGVVAITLLSIWGTWRIVTDTYTIGYFPEGHMVLQDNQNIEKHWGYYMPLDILIYPSEGKNMQSPEVLQKLSEFGASVQKLNGIGEVRGYHSFFEASLRDRYNSRWKEKLGSETVVKNVASRAEQYYPELVRNFVTPDYSLGRVYLTSKMVTARGLTAKMDSIQQIASSVMGKTAVVKPSGYQSLYADIVNYITQSQINSFVVAVILIFLLVLLFLRSFKLSLISLVPNFFPVFLMLGFMGWVGIYLDSATASIAAIVLSFSIDDTIHFVHHYKKSKQMGHESHTARKLTIKHVGRAIVLTSTILFFGYILMVFGQLKSVVYFGLLTAIAIVGALFSQLVIFPLLLSRFDK